MSQKLQDFVKDRRTQVVTSNNDEYYLKIKEDRKRAQEMNELHQRIAVLEREVSALKEIVRGRFEHNTTSK